MTRMEILNYWKTIPEDENGFASEKGMRALRFFLNISSKVEVDGNASYDPSWDCYFPDGSQLHLANPYQRAFRAFIC